MKSVICAIVKDEQLFIREWVDWYLNKGFSKLYIYEDYGSTSHESVLADYIKSGKVVLTAIDGSGLPIQNHPANGVYSTQKNLYAWFLNQCKTGNIEADWVGFFDVDEFINFEDGYDLEKLEQEYKDNGGVLLSWIMYGASGHLKRPKGGVVENYTQHLPIGTLCESGPQWAIKSLVNVHKCEGMIHIHAFKGCINTEGGDKNSPLSFKKAWINHYFTKSWEDYLIRIFKRGNMRNNYRCLDKFFQVSPEFEPYRKQMIEEQRYNHTACTMWVSRKYKIISGGNVNKLKKLNIKYEKR